MRLVNAAKGFVNVEIRLPFSADELRYRREHDLRDPVATYEAVREATGGSLADLTVNTTNVGGTEGATILATRSGGRAFFFSMATSFTAAALTAEGVGRDIAMLIGNGYTEGWTDVALDLYRANPPLAALLQGRLGA